MTPPPAAGLSAPVAPAVPTLVPSEGVAARSAAASSRILDLCVLLKLRIAALVVLATLAGLYLGSAGVLPPLLVFHALLGTALLSAAASGLNQLLEIRFDARMKRTEGRPLPAGRVTPAQGLFLGALLSTVGLLELALGVNGLTALLGAFTLASYLFAYTPLKRRTHLSLLVGGVPGALPPVMGFAAARGSLGPEALALFAILFFWQIPHFLAIARLHQDDYRRGGFPVLPLIDRDGTATGRAILVNCLALLPAGLLPAALRLTGAASLYGSLALGLGFLAFGVDAALRQGRGPARRLLFASLFYLPALLLLFMIDKS
jgi:protoheme IX farnesyltransferase